MKTTSLPRRSALAIAVVVALAFGAVTVASASAAEWVQGQSKMKWSASTISLEKGGKVVNCSSPSMLGSPPLLGATEWGEGGVTNSSWYASISCEGKTTFQLCACFSTEGSAGGGVYTVYLYNRWTAYPSYQSPFGTYGQEAAEGTFTNGSVGKPSKLAFTDAVVGYTVSGGSPITMDATFDVTTSTGGLLTLEG
jgi:hypothetical protein